MDEGEAYFNWHKEKVKKSKVMPWVCTGYLLLFSPTSRADYGYLSEQRAEREEYRKELEEARTDNEYSGSGGAHHTSSSRTEVVPMCTGTLPLTDCSQEMSEEALIPAEATSTLNSRPWYILGVLSVVAAASVIATNGWRTTTLLLFLALRWLVGVAMIFSSPFWLITEGPDLPQWTSYTITTIPGWVLLIFATAIATWLAWEGNWDAVGVVPVFGGLVLFTALLGDAAEGFLLLLYVALIIGAFSIIEAFSLPNPLILPAVLAAGIGVRMLNLLAELTVAIAFPVSVDMFLVVLRILAAAVIPVLGVLLIMPDAFD